MPIPAQNDLTGAPFFIMPNIDVGTKAFHLHLTTVADALAHIPSERGKWHDTFLHRNDWNQWACRFKDIAAFYAELDNVWPYIPTIGSVELDENRENFKVLDNFIKAYNLPSFSKFLTSYGASKVSNGFYSATFCTFERDGNVVYSANSFVLEFDINGKLRPTNTGYLDRIRRNHERVKEYAAEEGTVISYRELFAQLPRFLKESISFAYAAFAHGTSMSNISDRVRFVMYNDNGEPQNYAINSKTTDKFCNLGRNDPITFERDPSGNFLIKRPYNPANTKEKLYQLKSYSFDFFSFAGKTRIMTAPTEAEDPIYGVELELSTDYSVQKLIDALEPVWICAKSDGSIRGNKPNMYEMVTLPMTYSAHAKLWGQWFRKLDMKKFDTSYNTNNGMHVHVAREAFDSARHIRDFAWWFTAPQNNKFVIDFSGRGSLNAYCSLPDIPITAKRAVVRRDILRYIGGLRGVINLNKGATIEVRLFKGVVAYSAVMKNLDLVDAVFHLTRRGISYTKDPLTSLLEYLNSPELNDNKYFALREYIKDMMNIDSCVDYSQAVNACMGKRSVDEVLMFLEKHDITFKTSAGAAKINHLMVGGMPPKVAWNKKTGRIQNAVGNKSADLVWTPPMVNNQPPILTLEEKMMGKFNEHHHHTARN